MNASRSWTWTLTAAGVLQIGMALAHFGLQYEWRGVDGGSLPTQLRWALFALNFSWSALVLLVGGLIIYGARLDPRAPFVRALIVVVAIFWAVHGIYMVVEAMPLPPRLAWIQGPIVAFPATLILLHGVALLATKRRARITAAAAT
jgi:hypothetical protein